jgi:hypothetical protein
MPPKPGPKQPVAQPPGQPGPKQPGQPGPKPFPKLTGGKGGAATADDAATLQFLKDKIKELQDHLMKTYPNDRRSQTIKVNFKEITLVPEYAMRQGILGGFTYETGILEMALYDDGKKRDEGSLLTSLLHEMGHCCDSFVKIAQDHGPQWRAHTEWLMQVATKELKWNVTMLCGDCPGYLLCKMSQCPLCKWECPPPRNPPTQPDAEQAPGDDFLSYPRESYSRVCKQGYTWPWLVTMCKGYETRHGASRKHVAYRGAPVAAPDEESEPMYAPAPPPPPRAPLIPVRRV